MSHKTRWLSLMTIAALLIVAGAIVAAWAQSSSEYVPVLMDSRQQLVENPTILTPAHLDRVEAVLKGYGEWYHRVDATHLRISRKLSHDRELLWNYTMKAEDGSSAGR